MTISPNEPLQEPDVVPSGDPVPIETPPPPPAPGEDPGDRPPEPEIVPPGA